jgi:hypothetical protein
VLDRAGARVQNAASDEAAAEHREAHRMEGEENRTRITILTRSFRIKGYIHITPSARVTDYMVESKNFIAITDAEVWELSGRQVLQSPFINVSRDHIEIVMPGG